MSNHEDVEFKTLDGLTLRGSLYPAQQKGPGIVITPGVGPLKTAILFLPRASGEMHAPTVVAKRGADEQHADSIPSSTV
jgi:hypothetical protein